MGISVNSPTLSHSELKARIQSYAKATLGEKKYLKKDRYNKGFQKWDQ